MPFHKSIFLLLQTLATSTYFFSLSNLLSALSLFTQFRSKLIMYIKQLKKKEKLSRLSTVGEHWKVLNGEWAKSQMVNQLSRQSIAIQG